MDRWGLCRNYAPKYAKTPQAALGIPDTAFPGRRRGARRGARRARRLPRDGVALHAARVRGGDQLTPFALHRGHAPELPRADDRHLMAAPSQLGDDVVPEAGLDVQRPQLDVARRERLDQVMRLELRRVDRRLQVEAPVDMAQQRVERPL